MKFSKDFDLGQIFEKFFENFTKIEILVKIFENDDFFQIFENYRF